MGVGQYKYVFKLNVLYKYICYTGSVFYGIIYLKVALELDAGVVLTPDRST